LPDGSWNVEHEPQLPADSGWGTMQDLHCFDTVHAERMPSFDEFDALVRHKKMPSDSLEDEQTMQPRNS
jgi:hypothetical protein